MTQVAIGKAEAMGQLFVASAGNNNGTDIDEKPVYPASYNNSNMMTVTAVDQNEQLAYYSNKGFHSTAIAAPGTHILSTVPNNSYG